MRWSCCGRGFQRLTERAGAPDGAGAGIAGVGERGRGALLDQVVDYYHQTLKGSPQALAYLQKRGIAGAGG